MSQTIRQEDSFQVPTTTAAEYARSDEELLRAGRRTFRVAVLSDHSLSVGVSQQEGAVCVDRAKELGLSIVHRSTGGLALWHVPGDLAWSLVLPRPDPLVGPDFTKAYARLGAGPSGFLSGLGIASSWTPPAGRTGEFCLLSGRGLVLSVGGRALGGAAQHITADALLHHGVLPYHLEPPRLAQLFDLSPETVERSLTSLQHLIQGVPSHRLARQLRSALATAMKQGGD